MRPGHLNNVALIGYRGSGKTTVGRLLAKRLGWTFVDTDDLIVSDAGTSIADIFAAEGETGFRQHEYQAIAGVTQGTHQVIAVGGGAVTDADNVERLRSGGTVVWLTAPPEVLWARIKQDEQTASARPDLTTGGGLAEVRTVLAEREAAYEAAADVRMDTANRSPDDVAAAAETAVRARLGD
jgi:shikimate kinase